jgi:hypothetical protein
MIFYVILLFAFYIKVMSQNYMKIPDFQMREMKKVFTGKRYLSDYNVPQFSDSK